MREIDNFPFVGMMFNAEWVAVWKIRIYKKR